MGLGDIERINCETMLGDFTLSANDLLAVINNLEGSKKLGPDHIPPYFIKRCLLIVVPLIALYNKSIGAGSFPKL